MASPTFTIVGFNRLFPDNDACLAYLFKQYHADTQCPKCGRIGKYHRQKNTAHFVCQCGGHQISPKRNTIFEKSATELVKWFYAIFLMSQSCNGISAKEIQRQCRVTYKTAWRMAKHIRPLMQDDSGDDTQARIRDVLELKRKELAFYQSKADELAWVVSSMETTLQTLEKERA